MSGLIVAMIALFSTVTYLAVAGVVFIRVLRARLDACRTCISNQGKTELWRAYDSHDGPYTQATLCAVFWPVALFAVLPAVFADPHRGRQRAEAMQRRIQELEREVGI